jgi:hypothetical protein
MANQNQNQVEPSGTEKPKNVTPWYRRVAYKIKKITQPIVNAGHAVVGTMREHPIGSATICTCAGLVGGAILGSKLASTEKTSDNELTELEEPNGYDEEEELDDTMELEEPDIDLEEAPELEEI